MRLFDLARAAKSTGYCDEIKGRCRKQALQLTGVIHASAGPVDRRASRLRREPSTVLRHPRSAATRPPARNGRSSRCCWLPKRRATSASRPTPRFRAALAWPFVYPWPQRPAGLVETAFDELARRWTPILNAFDEVGVDVCYEIHPGEDLHDGITYEMFLERVEQPPAL